MITNEKAKILFDLEKQTKEKQYILPNPNEILTIELLPLNEHYENEIFNLDINRKYLALSKRTFQTRVQQTIVLRRLDFYAGHRNPTISFVPKNIGSDILELMKKYENIKFEKETHIHFYIDGYGERWAFPVNEFSLFSSTSLYEQAKEFCKYCNIKDIPEFTQKDLLCMV
ncbi:MAG: hypothetical protein Q8R86_06855 [Sulfuricurvum sp.]|nr:hypothetical protein [Sulfuricurvum sp.]